MVKPAPLLFSLVLCGCADTAFNPTPGSAVYAPYPGEVAVLSAFPQEGTYEQLGIVIAEGVYLTEKEDLVEDVKAAAAKRGANAVVLQGEVRVYKTPRGGETKKLGAYALRLNP